MERDLGLRATENGGFMGGVITSRGHAIPKTLPRTAFVYRIPITRITAQVVGGLEVRFEERGIEVVIADDADCKELMRRFIEEKPELWAEDIADE